MGCCSTNQMDQEDLAKQQAAMKIQAAFRGNKVRRGNDSRKMQHIDDEWRYKHIETRFIFSIKGVAL